MPSLAEMYGDFRNRVSKQHFGPGQSVIWSTINDPKLAAEKAADWLNQSYALAGSYDPYSEAVPEKAIESAIGLSGLMQTGAMPFAPSGAGTLGSIKASHGSPHSFEKFLMSKIGTGEGAQAYGHGLYFGEGFDSPVAEKYRQALRDQSAGAIADKFLTNWGDKDKAIQNLSQLIERKRPDFVPESLKPYEDALQMIKSGEPISSEGNLYNVELRWPDAAREAADPLGPEHFLQWDRPLSEQSDYVKNILRKADPIDEEVWPHWNGQQLYEGEVRALTDFDNLTKGNARARFSDRLQKAGIPGIRYLDQGSRGAGQGTHNYVVFDENIPNIVSRNGVSLSDLLRR